MTRLHGNAIVAYRVVPPAINRRQDALSLARMMLAELREDYPDARCRSFVRSVQADGHPFYVAVVVARRAAQVTT